MNVERPTWTTQTKLAVSLLLVALFAYLLSRFSQVLAPLVLAFILAYILSPIANLIHLRLHLHRVLAILLTYILVLAVLASLPMVIIPILADQVSVLNLDIQQFFQQVIAIAGRRYAVAGLIIDPAILFSQAIEGFRGLLEPVFSQTLSLAVEVITSVVWVIFIVVVSFYLIKDSQRLSKWFEGLVPPIYRADYLRLRDDIGMIWASFFRGQLVLALVVAVLFTIVGFILGIPFALVMGVFAGLLEFLPSVGHGIWLVTAGALTFSLGSTWMPLPSWAFGLVVVGLHLFYQQFDLNYLIPRIIGRSVHLPPLVIILGIVAGAVLAGVLGILLAAPTIASARVVGRYIYANLFNMDPFPGSAAPALPPPNPRWWGKKIAQNTSDSSEIS